MLSWRSTNILDFTAQCLGNFSGSEMVCGLGVPILKPVDCIYRKACFYCQSVRRHIHFLSLTLQLSCFHL